MTTPVFPLLWFSSSTPARQGQTRCRYARWAGYHAGTHGTGYRRKSTAIPLATGSGVHKGLELLGTWLMRWQAANPGKIIGEIKPELIAWAATEAATRYRTRAESKGLLDPDNQAIKDLINEQATLIEGLVWIWGLYRLPQIVSEYKILHVEFEDTMVLECTCGIDDGSGWWEDHQARGCEGIVQQAREDWMLERWSDQSIAALEFKTKATERLSWEKSFEHSGQLFTNLEAATRRIGKPVSMAFVDVLFKGWRGRDKNAPPEAAKYQHSPLCVGWYRPAVPGITPEAVTSQYRYVDDYGKGHTLTRDYKRFNVWDPAVPVPAVRPGASRVENWVRQYIAPAQVIDLLKVLGPFPDPGPTKKLQALAAIAAEENAIRADVEYLREHQSFDPGDQMVSGVPMVDQVIPRSWECTGYDGSPCEFAPICNRQPGWEHPLSMGIYEIRRPHHQPERKACEELGVVFPPDEFGDEDGESDD